MANDATNAADTGVLSNTADTVERDEPAAPAPAKADDPADTEQPEADPTADGDGAPEGASEVEPAEADEPAHPALDPPQFWDAKAKDRFRELPRDVQELLLANETRSAKATSEKFEEAAKARKTADGEASRLAAFNATLDKLIPQAETAFQTRWGDGNIDWNAVVDQHGADTAFKLKAQFEQEQSQIQQLRAAKDEAEHVEFVKFVEVEGKKLNELVPEFADAKEGQNNKAKLGKYLIDAGIPSDRIPHLTALEASIAWKAAKWDEAQAKAKTLASTPKPAAPAKPVVKPTASVAGAPSTSANLRSAQNAFNANPSLKNAIALDQAREAVASKG